METFDIEIASVANWFNVGWFILLGLLLLGAFGRLAIARKQVDSYLITFIAWFAVVAISFITISYSQQAEQLDRVIIKLEQLGYQHINTEDGGRAKYTFTGSNSSGQYVSGDIYQNDSKHYTVVVR